MGARAQLGSLDDPLGPIEGGSSAPRLPDWGSQVTACAASCHSGKNTALSIKFLPAAYGPQVLQREYLLRHKQQGEVRASR